MLLQVEGAEVSVGFEWGNDGSLHVDAAANGASPAQSSMDSHVSPCFEPKTCQLQMQIHR